MIKDLTNFDYYSNKYEGEIIPQESFDKIQRQASNKVNYFTFNRIKETNESIQDCVCEIAELLFEQNQLINSINDSQNVQSETVGPHSVTYQNNSNLKAQRILSSNELDKECYGICVQYLGLSGLMYRGGIL